MQNLVNGNFSFKNKLESQKREKSRRKGNI